MNQTNRKKLKQRAAALAVASCMSLSPFAAQAAGLGKLTVLSGLGQPLRAEMDIGASKDELIGMTARLAPREAFQQAGLDYSSNLLDLRFSIEKRGDQAVVKVTSSKPVNEPFLDFLVELNWPAGRLVREYTFLLDPPEIAARQPERTVADARVVETVRGGSAAETRSSRAAKSSAQAAAKLPAEPKPVAEKPAPEKKEKAEPKKPAETAGQHVVQQGETLRKIAAETQPEGVSLEQMLVGLYQANPDAFLGKNINRLKTGAILNVPDQATVAAIPEAEAKKVYVAHARNWNDYRQKLASAAEKAPVADDAAGQASSGKITARVEEKAAPADQSKDQVKVARTDAKGKTGESAAMEADRVAKERALKEAQERVSSLEKNVNELQKLLEMKNQKLAEMQQAQAAKPAQPEPPKAVEPPPPAPAPAPAAPAEVQQPTPPAEPPKPAEEAPKAEEQKPVEPVKPAEPPKPPVAPPPPVEEPGMLDSLLEDPLPLVGGAGLLAVLGGLFAFSKRRSRKAGAEETTALPVPSSLGPNSVFRMTGGQSVDTGNVPPLTGEFSQTGPGTIDTDEVDPVAEADVYMAYGRDTQAEEILLEALQKDPQRTAIHAKLLEIYAGRRSMKQFETLAGELYAQTGGAGPDWEKAAALGASLDPANPLYSRAQVQPAPVSPAAVAPVAAAAPMQDFAASMEPVREPVSEPQPSFSPESFELPKEIPAEAAATDIGVPAEAQVVETAPMALDFNLVDEPAPEPVAPVRSEPAPVVEAENALDFDLSPQVEEVQASVPADSGFDEALPDFSPEGTLVVPPEEDRGAANAVVAEEPFDVGAQAQANLDAADFDFEMSSPATETIVNPVSDLINEGDILGDGGRGADFGAEPAQKPLAEDDLDFDVKLTDSIVLGQPMPSPEFDIGTINLDLSQPSAEMSATDVGRESGILASPARDERWEETNTKLDLAKAYEEMGDLEGARELLEEVAGEGIDDLAQQARAMLERIGG